MTDEHTRFIASGYTEQRWQQLLRSSERNRLKAIALRDWSYEHPVEVKEPIPKAGTIIPKTGIPKVEPKPTRKTYD